MSQHTAFSFSLHQHSKPYKIENKIIRRPDELHLYIQLCTNWISRSPPTKLEKALVHIANAPTWPYVYVLSVICQSTSVYSTANRLSEKRKEIRQEITVLFHPSFPVFSRTFFAAKLVMERKRKPP